uniref:Thioredoxin domain-containing protein n=1 Tax=Caenorhabditis tropicalis TaxID=1561998 RepID=A0A1I7SYY2_9PELO
MSELLAGVKLFNQDGDVVDGGEYLNGKVVGLYFSAGWCPPCRAFTPKLKRFFEEIKKSHPEFEVVFVSRDRADEDLREYFNEHMGNWVAIEFGNPKIQELLAQYEVKTIPSMRIIKPNGDVVVQDARTEIQDKGSDPEALWEEWLAFYE